jgi:hypothetical protein
LSTAPGEPPADSTASLPDLYDHTFHAWVLAAVSFSVAASGMSEAGRAMVRTTHSSVAAAALTAACDLESHTGRKRNSRGDDCDDIVFSFHRHDAIHFSRVDDSIV